MGTGRQQAVSLDVRSCSGARNMRPRIYRTLFSSSRECATRKIFVSAHYGGEQWIITGNGTLIIRLSHILIAVEAAGSRLPEN